MKEVKYYISEIFHSFQGEGMYCGNVGPWVRFFGCNLQCQGFGQDDPTDPSTWKQPHLDWDVDSFKSVEELPMFEYGCDSAYSVNKRFRKLLPQYTVEIICDRIERTMMNVHNPNGLFKHPKTGVEQHFHITGGEPLLQRNQQAIVAIMKEFHRRGNMPKRVTIETNGTQALTGEFLELFYSRDCDLFKGELFFSVSPKLFNVSGENNIKAIRPEIVGQYWKPPQDFNKTTWGQLKFVVNGTDACWAELETALLLFRDAGIQWPVYIMPCGATKEQQEEVAEITIEAMKRGYKVSGRLHCYVFGNQVGT